MRKQAVEKLHEKTRICAECSGACKAEFPSNKNGSIARICSNFASRADAAEARAKELEAQCAAMREALRIAIGMLEAGAPAPSHLGPCTPEAGCDGECMSAAHFSQSMQSIRSSLSGDAGRALLERVEALERVADEVRASIVRPESALSEAMAALDALEPKR